MVRDMPLQHELSGTTINFYSNLQPASAMERQQRMLQRFTNLVVVREQRLSTKSRGLRFDGVRMRSLEHIFY